MTNSLNKGSGQTVFSSGNLQIRDEEGYLVNFIVSYSYPNNALKMLLGLLKSCSSPNVTLSVPVVVERLQHKYIQIKVSFTENGYIVIEDDDQSNFPFEAMALKDEFEHALAKLLSIEE